jgi:hypothetical protein
MGSMGSEPDPVTPGGGAGPPGLWKPGRGGRGVVAGVYCSRQRRCVHVGGADNN